MKNRMLKSVCLLSVLACAPCAQAGELTETAHVCPADAIRKDCRPPVPFKGSGSTDPAGTESADQFASGLDVYELFSQYAGYDGSLPAF